MRLQLVEALVVERGHELRLGGGAVGFGDGQRPFLLLSGREPIAEGAPLQVKVHIGHGPAYGSAVVVGFALLHPGKGEQQTVAIAVFVFELAVDEFVRKVHGSAL